MRAQSLPRPQKRTSTQKKRKTAPARRQAAGTSSLAAWWPLLAGIAITVVAVKTAEILPLMGAAGLLKLQLLYPFALLLKQPQLGLAEQTSDQWSQMMLYAQWVLYGFYVSLAIHWTSRGKALLQIAAFHFAGFAALWFLSTK